MYVSKIHLFPARLPSCWLCPATLHSSGPGLQIPQAHLASPPWQTASQPWGITAPGTLWKAAQQGHGLLKTLLQSKAQALPPFLPYSLFLSRSRISWQSSKYTNYRLLPWIKTSLHFKKVEGVEQGRGEGTFASDLVFKRGLTAYVCALPCNLKAPQDRTLKSILCWTTYTSQSKRTGSSLHPFQSAQLLLNQHCQKARQHYNKLAPLTIC